MCPTYDPGMCGKVGMKLVAHVDRSRPHAFSNNPSSIHVPARACVCAPACAFALHPTCCASPVPGTLGQQWAYDPLAVYKDAPTVIRSLIAVVSKVLYSRV